jgi:mannose-6-phosphate isomerase
MSDLYPLLIRPQFHERVWGSRDLQPVYAREITGNPIGESWLTGDECLAVNGPLAGRSLADLCREFGSRLVGETARNASRFPLLIKFLFPKDRLSVQVHPDDEIAKRAGESCGKNECWYILRAEPGAQIALGLKPGTSKAQVERAIHEARLEQLLNWIDARPGEMFYVDAGTVHAIGPGLVIVETQQNSDTTYRLYDYGRPRELHIAQGLNATKEQTHAGRVVAGQVETEPGKTQTNLVTSPNFVVDRFKMTQAWQFQRDGQGHARRSVWCLVPVNGCGVLECEGGSTTMFSVGEALVVPAAVDRFILRPQWDLEFLCASLPVETAGHPPTSLFENAAREAK